MKAYTQLAGADDIDVFIALGTPQRPEYKTKKGKVKQHYNVYSENDNVQLNAGPFWMLFGAGRRDGSATNIEISQVGGNPVSHSDLHTVEVWDALWSAINTNAAPSQSQPNPTPGSEDDPGVQDIRRGYSLPGHKNPAKEAEEIYLYRLQKTLDEKNKKKKGEKENM